MLRNASIKVKILALVLPLMAGIVGAGVKVLMGYRGELVQSSGLRDAALFNQSLFALIVEIQGERGKSALFLAGKASKEELETQRKAATQAGERAKARLDAVGLPDKDVSTFGGTLKSLDDTRALVDGRGDAQSMASRYSSAVGAFTALEVSAAGRYHVNGLETPLLSMAIFDRAKEDFGMFRIALTDVLAADKPFGEDLLSLMETRKAGARSHMESPGLILSEQAATKVREAFESQEWQSVLKTYDKVKGQRAQGHFGEDAQAVFAKVTEVMNRLAKAMEAEVAGVVEKAEQQRSAASVVFWTWFFSIVAGVLGTAFFAIHLCKGLVESFTGISGKLAAGSDEVASASLSISETASELSSATTEQAAALQETVSSVEQVSAMVSKNADNARRSQSASGKSFDAAKTGKEAVERMIGSIEEISRSNSEIAAQMEESNRRFFEIVQVITAIGDKTKVINDIVFQTKLLSFNASVEAARAGEHGKGFAVVAEEVGNLAQMSGNAAKEISGLLEGSVQTVEKIVNETKDSVSRLVSSGKEKIETGISTARRCGETLDEIVTHVGEVNQMVGEIATASHEQAQGVQEIGKAISQLDQATQSNAVASQRCASSVEKLTMQASLLQGVVGALSKEVHGAAQSGKPAEARPPEVKPAAVVKRTETKQADAKPVAKVVPLRQPEKTAPKVKRVVGMDHVPSEDDPRFKDV